jgi:hypothetical protein
LDMLPSVGGYEAAIFDLAKAVDLVLIPTGASRYDWDIAIDWMALFKTRSFRNVRFLINKVPDFRRKSFLRIHGFLSRHGLILPIALPLRDDVFLSTDQGLTTIDLVDAKGSAEFEALWNNVYQELGL